MTIDQLIAELQRLKEEWVNGDILVVFDANSTSLLRCFGVVNHATLAEDKLAVVLHEV